MKREESSPDAADEGWRLEVLELPCLEPAGAVRCRATRVGVRDALPPEIEVWAEWPRPLKTILPGARFHATELRARPDAAGGSDAVGVVDRSSKDNLLLGAIVADDRALYKPLLEICSDVGDWFVHTIDRMARHAVDAANASRVIDPFVASSITNVYTACTARYAAMRRCGELPNAVLAALTPRELDSAVDTPSKLLRLSRPHESTRSALHPLRLVRTADGLLERLPQYEQFGSTRIEMHVRAAMLARTGPSYLSNAQLCTAAAASMAARDSSRDEVKYLEEATSRWLRRDEWLTKATINALQCVALPAVADEESKLATKLRAFARRNEPSPQNRATFTRARLYRQGSCRRYIERIRRLSDSQSAAVDGASGAEARSRRQHGAP